jgi:hypothetical protein
LNDLVIQTRGLRNSYDGTFALRGIDLAVPATPLSSCCLICCGRTRARRFNPLRGFLLSAYTTAIPPRVTPASLPVPLVREPLQSAFASAPWVDAWIGSALLASLCCFAAVRILDRKEY